MTFEEAIAQLRTWCDLSMNRPIPIGVDSRLAFSCRPVEDDEEIRHIEHDLEWPLPKAYARLLRSVGSGKLFINKYGLGVHLYAPSQVLEMSEGIWESWEQERATSHDRFCIIGHHNGLGDAFGFVISRPGPRNFDVFCHEYPPFEYASVSDGLDSWKTLDQWIIRLVESHAKDIL